MGKPSWLTLPNVLSLSRIFMMPVLVWLAHSPWPAAFLVLYVIVGSTDLFDGILARRLNQVSPVGKELDSVADLVFYLGSAYFLYALFTPVIVNNALYLYVFFAILALSLLVPILRFKRFVMMHTKLLKLGAVLVYLLVVFSYFYDTTYLARFIIVFYYAALLEEILIYFIYGNVDPDTTSIFSLRT